MERGFYLTYEELKLYQLWQNGGVKWGFYLTYEELKHSIQLFSPPSCSVILSYLWGIETRRIWFFWNWWVYGFYLTYEELKHRYELYVDARDMDFILPMRNWNYQTWKHSKKNNDDFILPMRNWNYLKWGKNAWWACDFILPMRNWNQFHCRHISHLSQWFYLTYEELKQISWNCNCKRCNWILSYLWGIETCYGW